MAEAKKILELKSLESTRSLAEELAKTVQGGDTIGLIGPLGAGKTTFIRELCSFLGTLDPVSSPSFVLQHEYRTNGELLLDHWDLYRASLSPLELLEPPLSNTIRMIEWADRILEDQVLIQIRITLTMSLGNRYAAVEMKR